VEQQRHPIPPVYFLLTLVIMGVLHSIVPLAPLVSGRLRYGGLALLALGIGSVVSAAGLFSKLGTPVRPFEKSTTVVTSGMFRLTRNPMYLGMVIGLIGVAILLGSVVVWLPIPIFIAIIHSRFILREERFMEDLFGEQYLAYKRRVRRWI
jgi:protein-S-isoprenylcysteine O-methyltransferase Ste14